MGIEHSHHLENPNATTPPPKLELISSVPAPPVPDNAEAMTILVTLPPGSAGNPPHRHTGPAFGYMIKGEMIFELEGEPQRVVKAGESFWEPAATSSTTRTPTTSRTPKPRSSSRCSVWPGSRCSSR
ncbi:cupin domain-containing protein [Acrocarpospora sp. B8E8]|uniref:cupin domain-containing protein n=1 Tax=Acrocarpospora sp. B8E8 TaxID=3153572 RepID=UPI00325C4036